MLTGDSASMEEAIASFQSSLRYNSQYRWTYLYLSISLIAQGQLEESISIAQQVLKLSNANISIEPTSTHAWAHNILGYAFEIKGDYRAAVAEYQSAIQLDKSFTPAKINFQQIQDYQN